MVDRIEGDATGQRLDKRTYLPGIRVVSTCPKGGEESVQDLEHTYFSYPKIGEVEQVDFWCEDHDAEWAVPVVLDLTLRLATEEPAKHTDEAWVQLLAKYLEFEHALEHVIECGSCDSCKTLAQSAFDGLNREDFTEIAREQYG